MENAYIDILFWRVPIDNWDAILLLSGPRQSFKKCGSPYQKVRTKRRGQLEKIKYNRRQLFIEQSVLIQGATKALFYPDIVYIYENICQIIYAFLWVMVTVYRQLWIPVLLFSKVSQLLNLADKPDVYSLLLYKFSGSIGSKYVRY